MKISVIGTGYVGLVLGACLADMGNTVICVDKDSKKVEDLQKRNLYDSNLVAKYGFKYICIGK